MRYAWIGLAAGMLALGPPTASAAGSPFDGAWQTTVSCEDSHGGLGYSFQFVSTISNGTLHGQRGTVGKPSSMVLDGPVAPDGRALLYADGYVGSRINTPGQELDRGTEYGYHVRARFNGSAGTGERVEGRRCTYEFHRQ